jgi:hypothetical protein
VALDFLSESPADAADAKAMQTESPPPDPAPAPDPAPEPKPDPVPAADAKPAEPAKPEPKQPFVSHAALHEERQRRQALEAEVAALKAGKQPAEEPKEIDPETDPIAALKEVREFQAKQREEQIMQNQLREFDDRVRTHEAEWGAANPDYSEHIAFLGQFRANQLRALYPHATEKQIGAQLTKEARETAFYAFQNGKNPGEVFSEIAKVSGWKPKEAAAPAAAPEPAGPDPAIEARKAESEAALERISRGQKAARKTAGAGGDGPEPEMTVEKLANLTGAAFDAAMEKHGKRLFGG